MIASSSVISHHAVMKDPLPPLHVVIVGSLMLGWGMFAFVGMAAGALAGHPAWDIGFLIVFLGWNMFNRKRAYWITSIIVAFLLIIPGLLFAILHATGTIKWSYPDSPRDLIGSGLLAAASIYAIIVLLRANQRDWFRRPGDEETINDVDTRVATRIAAPVLVVSFLLSSLYQLQKWWANETLRTIYTVETTLVAYDAETGQPLANSHVPLSPNKRSDREVKLPLYTSSYGMYANKTDITIKGLTNKSFRVPVVSDGYEDASVLIEGRLPAEIRVPMKRKK